jgi:GNAT superfamily N-acetyltransferase
MVPESMPRPTTFFADHALSARLEAVEAAQLAGLARIVAERLPAQGATSISVAGGTATFVAPHISVSRAAGLGMSGPLTAAEIDALEEFYRSRDTEARVLVSPFADASLFEELGDRGFRLVNLYTALIRHIDPGEAFPAPTGEVAVRRAEPDEAAAWVASSLRSFAPDAPVDPVRAAIFEAGFAWPGTAYFFATVGGAFAGTASVFVHGRTAHLFAASTEAEHRGRGAQGALIAARLAFARDAGCDLACTGTSAGSASQRNMERWGFSPVYSQALMMKRYGPR